MNAQTLVAKVWNFAHVLRDQGVSYQAYISQISYLLFLKMDEERVTQIGEASELHSLYQTADFDTALTQLRSDAKLAVVTRSEKGCVVASKDGVTAMPAFPIDK